MQHLARLKITVTTVVVVALLALVGASWLRAGNGHAPRERARSTSR